MVQLHLRKRFQNICGFRHRSLLTPSGQVFRTETIVVRDSMSNSVPMDPLAKHARGPSIG